MGGVVAARLEWLDRPAECLEHLADGAVNVPFAPGLGQLEPLRAVPAAHGVDQFLGSLPAERDALAILAPLVVGERTVQLEAELLVADAVLEPLQVRLQQLKTNLRDAERRLDSAKCEGEAGEISRA